MKGDLGHGDALLSTLFEFGVEHRVGMNPLELHSLDVIRHRRQPTNPWQHHQPDDDQKGRQDQQLSFVSPSFLHGYLPRIALILSPYKTPNMR